MIKSTTQISRREDVLSSDIDGESALMSRSTWQYVALNKIGSDVWQLLEKPQSVNDLLDTLCEQYDVSREQCEKDVLPFLNELKEREIIDTTD